MTVVKLAHLTTVDLSLRYLVLPQLERGVDMGWDTIGISAAGPDVAEIEAAGVRHLPLTSSTRGWALGADLKAAWQLWRILRRERIDILHTHNPKPGIYGRIVGRLAGVPIVVNTVHGLYATDGDPLLKRTVVYGLEAVASRFSDAELVQSAEDARLMRRHRLAPRHRLAHLGNGVDLTRFDPKRRADHRAQVRAELGIGDDQVVVGMVGRLVAEKGFPELVDATERLDEGYTVVVIGPDDPEKPDALDRTFVERAERLGIRLLGMRTDVERLYGAMDVFVLPSHREGVPRAAMEAAASGLPLVVTDVRGCREVVDDGDNGLLVPVQDPPALATAIRRLGDDDTLRRQMGAQSRAIAEERFDERRIVSTVFATYRGVALRKQHQPVLDAAYPLVAAPRIRPAGDHDIAHLARMHREAIATGFLPRLGTGFMERLYSALVTWDGAVVLVADIDGLPVGFVAGVADVGAFYRYFVRRHGIGAALAAAPRLCRPSVLRRAWETFRYGGDEGDPSAELLALAVQPEARRRGLGQALGQGLLTELASRGEPQVQVVVGADNDGAIAAYAAMGFVSSGTVEVHAGEPSEVMTWSAER